MAYLENYILSIAATSGCSVASLPVVTVRGRLPEINHHTYDHDTRAMSPEGLVIRYLREITGIASEHLPNSRIFLAERILDVVRWPLPVDLNKLLADYSAE